MKVENWIDGVEGRIYNGVTARFGTILPQKPENSVRTPAIFSNPVDCCSNSTSKVLFFLFHPASLHLRSNICVPLLPADFRNKLDKLSNLIRDLIHVLSSYFEMFFVYFYRPIAGSYIWREYGILFFSRSMPRELCIPLFTAFWISCSLYAWGLWLHSQSWICTVWRCYWHVGDKWCRRFVLVLHTLYETSILIYNHW